MIIIERQVTLLVLLPESGAADLPLTNPTDIQAADNSHQTIRYPVVYRNIHYDRAKR